MEYDKCFKQLSFYYADQYKTNPKNFINCFVKYKSIRMVCESIVSSYKRCNAFNECKEICTLDFMPFVNRFQLSALDTVIFSDILIVIYALING